MLKSLEVKMNKAGIQRVKGPGTRDEPREVCRGQTQQGLEHSGKEVMMA